MVWRLYQVVFRLRSPIHIGCGKVGNLQRTRPYVTGRVLWGALTMRLTRDQAEGRGPANKSHDYQLMGEKVDRSLAFTYFYPATKTVDGYCITWFWQEEDRFRQKFLSSFSGTALSHPYQSAALGMLHEVEFISPKTVDGGKPVFLMGYMFERDDNQLDWQSACKRLQIGGERGYGWGDIELVGLSGIKDSGLFERAVLFNGGSDRPIIRLLTNEEGMLGRLRAHALAENLPAAGDIEPLVGREWRSNALRHRHAGQYVVFNGMCFTPGSTVNRELNFEVGPFGVWKVIGDT